MKICCSNAGASWVGDNEWRRIFPEGERICTMQGNTISSTYQPNTQLRKRVGANCMNHQASSFSWFSSADFTHAKVSGYSPPPSYDHYDILPYKIIISCDIGSDFVKLSWCFHYHEMIVVASVLYVFVYNYTSSPSINIQMTRKALFDYSYDLGSGLKKWFQTVLWNSSLLNEFVNSLSYTTHFFSVHSLDKLVGKILTVLLIIIWFWVF